MNLKEKFDKWRYTEYGNFKFDRVIFNIACLILVIFFIAIAFKFGLSKESLIDTRVYVFCDDVKPCINPFYIDNSSIFNFEADHRLTLEQKQKCTFEWCKLEYLPPGFKFGETGEKIYNTFYMITIFIIILAFILNHILYNWGVKIEGS
jgi:hypothetical protein